MNFYERQILPPILNCVCGLPLLNGYREGIVKRARGSVLEIGLGSSLNTKFYAHEQVTEITGIDPNESLLQIAAKMSRLIRAKSTLSARFRSAYHLKIIDSIRQLSPSHFAPFLSQF